jgi:molybdate transport system substrate-binding protein
LSPHRRFRLATLVKGKGCAGLVRKRGTEMHSKIIGLGAAVVSLLFAAAHAEAAELKVFVGGAMTETVERIGADFAKRTGNKLDYVSDTTGALQKRLASGEKADIVVVTSAGLDAMQKENRIVPGSSVALVRALIGVAVRPGAPSPDLSSADGFKASLLAARSVSYVNPAAGGTSGTYFEGLMKRMGIADQMKNKIVYRNQGSEVADAVAKGDAELGISFIAELAPNKGIKVAGPLPPAIQSPTDYTAAILSVSPNADAARAFIQSMTSPTGGAVFKTAGLTVLSAAH